MGLGAAGKEGERATATARRRCRRRAAAAGLLRCFFLQGIYRSAFERAEERGAGDREVERECGGSGGSNTVAGGSGVRKKKRYLSPQRHGDGREREKKKKKAVLKLSPFFALFSLLLSPHAASFPTSLRLERNASSFSALYPGRQKEKARLMRGERESGEFNASEEKMQKE